jgi:hypothetical protein
MNIRSWLNHLIFHPLRVRRTGTAPSWWEGSAAACCACLARWGPYSTRWRSWTSISFKLYADRREILILETLLAHHFWGDRGQVAEAAWDIETTCTWDGTPLCHPCSVVLRRRNTLQRSTGNRRYFDISLHFLWIQRDGGGSAPPHVLLSLPPTISCMCSESWQQATCRTCFSKENQVHTYMYAKIYFHTYSDSECRNNIK